MAEQESDSWSTTLTLLNNGGGPVDQLKGLLAQLDDRVRAASHGTGLDKLKHRVYWPFKEPENLKLIAATERLKGLFMLALENNHIRLSKLIHTDLARISSDVESVKQELSANTTNLVLLSRSSEAVAQELHYNGQQIQILSQATGTVESGLERSTQKIENLGQSAKRTHFRTLFCTFLAS